MTLPCGWCDYPDPRDGDLRIRVVVDEDETVDACRSCAVLRMLSRHVRATLVLEPAAVMS